MNALVVDGDATARVMVRRILVRDFACDITEVDNGLDALDQLSEKQFGFMLLDPELPVIDGFRVLEAVRRTPEHQSLPVLIMTRQRDEAAVRKLAELGISDYLIKPLEATLTGARLSKLIGATGQANGGNGPANDHKRIPTLQPGASVMIVDGSSDFRQLFADALGEAATVTPVDSGVQALKRCKQVAPAAVFIGNELGVLHRDLLVSELRRIPAMFESLIIGIVEEDELETASQDTRWSSVVLRADTSQALSQKTSRFFDSQRPLDTVLRAHPSLEADLTSAAEQVCGMMLNGSVAVRPVTPQDDTGPQRIAAVTITLDKDDVALTLEIRCSVDSARQLSATVLGVAVGTVGKDDMESTLAELANLVAGRLQKGLSERGLTVSCGLPMARNLDGPPEQQPQKTAIALLVGSESMNLAIAVTLS